MLRLTALLAALLLLAPSGVAAQSVAQPILALRTARAPRVRVRAIEDIARMRPAGSRAALVEALRDRSPAVRRAAAITLGELGDPAALVALDGALRDRDRDVQRAARASAYALRTLPAASPSSAPLAAPPSSASASNALAQRVPPSSLRALTPPINWRTVRVLLTVDRLDGRALASPAEVELTREAMREAARTTPGFALHAGGPLPPAARSRSRSRALRWFSLEGSISQLQRQRDGAGVRVRAELSLAIVAEPVHNIVGTLSTAATAQEPPPPPSAPDPWSRLTRSALESVARGAIQRMQAQFGTSGPASGRRRRR
jgi:hypothetical protein